MMIKMPNNLLLKIYDSIIRLAYSFFFLFSIIIYSQQLDYSVEYLTTKEGLSSNYVTNIITDDLNTKWIATENGISKYNGNNFEIIKPGSLYPQLLNENIETLFKDSRNIIWIGTKSGGLSSINPVNNETKNYNSILGSSKEFNFIIFAINEDKNGRIWVGTSTKGVYVFNSINKKLIFHFKNGKNVRSIINDKKGNVWFSSEGELNFFDLEKEKLTPYHINSDFISDIVEDAKRNKILFISNNGLLREIDEKSKKVKIIEKVTSSNRIRNYSHLPTMSFDNDGRLWVGTWRHGLYVSDSNLENFKKIELINKESGKLPINYSSINHIKHSLDNTTWLSMANGGVVKLSPKKVFQSIKSLELGKALLKGKNITSVFKDNEYLYVGTLYSGLYKIDENGKTSHYKNTEGGRINTIGRYKDYIISGVKNGLHIIDSKTNKVIQRSLSFNSSDFFKKKLITGFFVDSSNSILIGTQRGGLFITDEEGLFNNQFEHIQSDNKFNNSRRITGIKQDELKNIWISTYNGLYLLSENNKMIRYSDFSKITLPNIINDIIVDEFIWLATPNGLYKLDYKSRDQNNNIILNINQIINKKNGLNNEFINSILKIKKKNSGVGSIWMSTMTEIVNYNQDNGGLTHYNEQDGVKVTMFNLRVASNDNNQTLYFGGNDNLTYASIDKINYKQDTGDLIFTDLKINNNKIYPNEELNGRILIKKNLAYLDQVNLSHKEKSFSIGFVNNDFKDKSKYAYRLIGYQDEWIKLGYKKEVDFTGLSSSLLSKGNYKLQIASSIDNVNWDNSAEILINIKPSPFLSLPALIIYFLTIVFFGFLILRNYSERIKLKNRLINIKMDKKRELKLTESKLSFFTNISHEFRTPLTLIISPLQDLLNNHDIKTEISSKLITVEKNANKLLNLINQLLDFRKSNHGLLKIKVAYGNFNNFSKEIFLLFSELAKIKKIEYNFHSKQEEINFPFDRNKMEIVLSNLISNAIKFSNEGGKIDVFVKSVNGCCIYTIRDTGIGIPINDLDKVFDEFYSVKTNSKTTGTGIGLYFSKKIIELHHGKIDVLSEYGIGTEIIVSINMDPAIYREVDLNFKKAEDISSYQHHEDPSDLTNLNIEAKETLLIIDDNKDIRTYLGSLLSNNYHILEAENGGSGGIIAIKMMPDLIICDIMMPVKDGITLCSELKKNLSTSHIPIILLTARNSTLFEISGLESGADDYITKPFNTNIVKARVKSLLENRNNTRKYLLNKVRFEPVIRVNSNDIEIGFIEKAITLVEENIQNTNFGIEKMTDHFCMSQSTLYRKVKSLTGLSLTGFIRSIRLKQAALLISTTNTKLSYICYEVGFNDYKYFRTSFKQQFNCLPSKYKNSKIINEISDIKK